MILGNCLFHETTNRGHPASLPATSTPSQSHNITNTLGNHTLSVRDDKGRKMSSPFQPQANAVIAELPLAAISPYHMHVRLYQQLGQRCVRCVTGSPNSAREVKAE